MLKGFDFSAAWEKITGWGGSTLWTPETLYQILIMAACFGLAGFVSRFFDKRLEDFIEAADIPFHVRKIAHNLRRLTLHFIALSLIAVGDIVMSAAPLSLNTGLMAGMEKLLLAWIVIKIALQFVDNRLVRNIFVFSIWGITALSIFGILDETSAALDAVAISVGNFRLSPLVVVKAGLSLFAVLYIALFASSFFERRIFKISGLTRSSQVLIAKGIRITLVVAAVLVGVTSAGIDLSLFAVFGGAVGLGVGFGLQKGLEPVFRHAALDGSIHQTGRCD